MYAAAITEATPIANWARAAPERSAHGWAAESKASDQVPDRSSVVKKTDRENTEESTPPGALTDPEPEAETENQTNEANFDETVGFVQNNKRVEVAANSGVEFGLDKLRVRRPVP
jgi:hypothetical protein